MNAKLAKSGFALALALTAITLGAQTRELTLRHYEFWRASEGPYFAFTIKVMQESFLYANASLVVDGKSPIYCQPGRLTLTGDASLEVLDKETKITNRSLDTPLFVVFLDGLRRTFPCAR